MAISGGVSARELRLAMRNFFVDRRALQGIIGKWSERAEGWR